MQALYGGRTVFTQKIAADLAVFMLCYNSNISISKVCHERTSGWSSSPLGQRIDLERDTLYLGTLRNAIHLDNKRLIYKLDVFLGNANGALSLKIW